MFTKAQNNIIFKVFIFLIPLVAADLKAQITSPDADAVRTTQYPVDTIQSPIYIYFSAPHIHVQGSLSATLPSPGTYNFEWFKYNPTSGSFDQLLLTHNAVTKSLLSNLTGGGYRVHISNGTDIDTSLTAWIHIDKLFTFIEKDEQGNVLETAYTCDYLTLSGAVTLDTFFYYDPVSLDTILLENGFTFLWTSDNSGLKIPNKDRILDPNTTYLPPYLDTWYILTATDSFGMEDIDSVFYESIQIGPDAPEPWFSVKFFDPAEEKDFVDPPNPKEGDAPLRVKFFNKSVNGYNYEWIFSDSATSDLFANEFTSDSTYEPEFMYKIPNDYYPSIVVTSEAGCIDTFRLPEPITVMPSLLEVPNVFSPNGDGSFDYFKVKFRSMKEFSIRIYDRAGKLVYKAEVSDMYKWEGWNGNVHDSNRPASPGAYFYVIDAIGWDAKQFNKEKQYKGVIYLFR